jgi:hypothetical protein
VIDPPEEIRFSMLKKLAISPAHYAHAVGTRDASERHQTIGTAAHAMVLGGQKVIAYHDGKRDPRTKKYQAFLEEHPTELILSPSEYAAAQGCANSIAKNRDAVTLLAGRRETELDPWTMLGRRCGGRPDVVTPDWVTELKTCHTAHPTWFVRVGIRMAYHAQLAWYLHGLRECGGRQSEAFIVVVETTAPYVVTTLHLTERALLAGEKLWRSWFELLLVCEDAGDFPPYALSTVEFDVPEMDDIEFTFGDESPADGEEAA